MAVSPRVIKRDFRTLGGVVTPSQDHFHAVSNPLILLQKHSLCDFSRPPQVIIAGALEEENIWARNNEDPGRPGWTMGQELSL